MICVGDRGICSDEMVGTGVQYLARIDDRYLVVVPIDPKGARTILPYKEAEFIDPLDRKQKSFYVLDELTLIY